MNMKNTLFLMTHLASGWEKLATVLEECPYLQVYQTGQNYSHPDDVKLLRQNPHKWPSSAAKYVDVIFHNKDFTMKRLCEHYQFIFWATPFEEVVDDLVNLHKYGRFQAEDYWSLRLEGMKQYYKRNPGSLWNPPLERETILAAILG